MLLQLLLRDAFGLRNGLLFEPYDDESDNENSERYAAAGVFKEEEEQPTTASHALAVGAGVFAGAYRATNSVSSGMTLKVVQNSNDDDAKRPILVLSPSSTDLKYFMMDGRMDRLSICWLIGNFFLEELVL